MCIYYNEIILVHNTNILALCIINCCYKATIAIIIAYEQNINKATHHDFAASYKYSRSQMKVGY